MLLAAASGALSVSVQHSLAVPRIETAGFDAMPHLSVETCSLDCFAGCTFKKRW